MTPLKFATTGTRLSVLCLGAHSDDIEIGAGATLLQWISSGTQLDVLWCVLSAGSEREAEAHKSASAFLSGAARARIETMPFRDGFFPAQGQEIKSWFEELKDRFSPDLILTHRRDDAHQDHREVCQHTWSTFRNHTVLEYEIPKLDGDIGRANIFVPISAKALERKVQLLITHFGTQRSKHWFDEDTFRGLARIRGLECRANERFAEAFFAHKLTL